MRTNASRQPFASRLAHHDSLDPISKETHMTASRIRAACIAVLLCTGLSALAFGDDGEKDTSKKVNTKIVSIP